MLIWTRRPLSPEDVVSPWTDEVVGHGDRGARPPACLRCRGIGTGRLGIDGVGDRPGMNGPL